MSNKKISVLMSIYNEPLSYIIQAINSILRQTHTLTELIIMVDNPSIDQEIRDYLLTLPDNVIVEYNKENIGLARSMNNAFLISTGDYIARMDSDDIAVNNRLELELNILIDTDADLVCSDYELIDENTVILENNYNRYTNKTLTKKLPYVNTIHHPTVLMKRSAFLAVNGYRNFPCSQDYDLWLRMYDKRMKFYIINEKLLKYRIRTTSITQKNGMKQSLTIRYIRKLFRERYRSGRDSYSLPNYDNYLRSHGLYDANVIECYHKNAQLKASIDAMRGHKRKTIKKLCLKVLLFLKSPFHRDVYIANLYDLMLEKVNYYKMK